MLAIWQAAPLAPAHTCTSGSTAATWGASVAHTTGQLTYRLGKADTLPYTERVGDPGPSIPLTTSLPVLKLPRWRMCTVHSDTGAPS